MYTAAMVEIIPCIFRIMSRRRCSATIAHSEFHAVMKVTADSDNPAFVAVGRSQLVHRDVVNTIGGAVATAVSVCGHDHRLLGT